ncbi:hypothetical protein T11_14059, partial [Trichinella zimbabwensis]
LDTRTVYICINIPGETSWVKEILRHQYNFKILHGKMHVLEESYEYSKNKRAKVDDGESSTQQSRMQKRWFIKVIIQKVVILLMLKNFNRRNLNSCTPEAYLLS